MCPLPILVYFLIDHSQLLPFPLRLHSFYPSLQWPSGIAAKSSHSVSWCLRPQVLHLPMIEILIAMFAVLVPWLTIANTFISMTTQLHILRLCLLRFCLLGLLFDYGYYDYYSIIPITITIISMTRILTSFRDSVEVDTIRSFVPSFMIHKSMLSSCRGVWQQAHCTCVLEYMYTLHCMNNIIFRTWTIWTSRSHLFSFIVCSTFFFKTFCFVSIVSEWSLMGSSLVTSWMHNVPIECRYLCIHNYCLCSLQFLVEFLKTSFAFFALFIIPSDSYFTAIN